MAPDYSLNFQEKGLFPLSHLPSQPGELLGDAFGARAGHEQRLPVLGLGPAILDPLTGQRSLFLEFQGREGRPDFVVGSKGRRTFKLDELGWVKRAAAGFRRGRDCCGKATGRNVGAKVRPLPQVGRLKL